MGVVESSKFAKDLNSKILEAVKQKIQEKFGSIRHPETGEFPTVVVVGNRLEDMRCKIEGSTALLNFIRDKLTADDMQGVEMMSNDQTPTPKAFLSYSSADHTLAGKIANTLQKKGIDTWWAEWEIGPGDSIRQKVDSGLKNCTHFLVLLTSNSLNSQWVQEEIDAGFVRAVDQGCKLIVLRHDVSIAQLPPLLRGRISPEIKPEALDLTQLVNSIHGVTQKPPLGTKPTATSTPNIGYSAAACKISEILTKKSTNGIYLDPQYTIDELAEKTSLTKNDVKDALHEIRQYVEISRETVYPKNIFFSEFDSFFMPWNTAEDSLKLAADIVNDSNFPKAPKEIDQRYNWGARRLNPVITYLNERNLACVRFCIGTIPYIAYEILGTDNTRRFVNSRT